MIRRILLSVIAMLKSLSGVKRSVPKRILKKSPEKFSGAHPRQEM
jgi:hypothetical protein